MMTTNVRGRTNDDAGRGAVPGIVIHRGRNGTEPVHPRISAFIWGGKVHPTPALPYGRHGQDAA